MTLTARLSIFFLGALGIVLAGFSTTLYVLAQTYLHRQADARLVSTLNTLVAAAEIARDGVVWEPHERQLSWGQEADPHTVRWLVCDERGRAIDRFPKAGADDSSGDVVSNEVPYTEANETRSRLGQLWRASSRRVLPDPNIRDQSAHPGGTDEPKYGALLVTAAVSLEPAQATLRILAGSLTGVSVGLWLLAAFVGRSLCRRALLPVTQMAAAARSMGANIDRRLPISNNGDEVAELGRAFNGLLDRLAESFERQRRFTGDASHQLRTPLTAVLGQIEVALRRERPPDEYRRVLSSVQRQALNLREIVEMLLFLARADAEARLPQLERVDLGEWVKEHLTLWQERARSRDFSLEVPADTPFWAEAQKPLLGQLVDNLLENACKYSEPGEPILLRVGRDGDSVCLSIQDRGCGITSEDLPHIFEPFYRSARPRRVGQVGVGLGLAIATRIVQAFGGRISVTTEPGRGTCFAVHLRSALDSLADPQAPSEALAGVAEKA